MKRRYRTKAWHVLGESRDSQTSVPPGELIELEESEAALHLADGTLEHADELEHDKKE